MFMKSLRLQYESEIAKAKDNIEVYLSNPAGIGEHPDLAAAIDSQVEVIAHAEDKLGVIMKHFGHKNLMKKEFISTCTKFVQIKNTAQKNL